MTDGNINMCDVSLQYKQSSEHSKSSGYADEETLVCPPAQFVDPNQRLDTEEKNIRKAKHTTSFSVSLPEYTARTKYSFPEVYNTNNLKRAVRFEVK